MFCKNCGQEVNEGAAVCLKCGVLVGMGSKFCQYCGFEPDPLAVICVKCGSELKKINNPAGLNVNHTQNTKSKFTFASAVKYCWKKYATFSGRATKSECWYFVLFCNLLMLIPFFLIISGAIGYEFTSDDGFLIPYYGGFVIMLILSLVVMLPSLSVMVRRLHDTGRSGWDTLFSLIPFVGGIILLVLLCQDSESSENVYGPNPNA